MIGRLAESMGYKGVGKIQGYETSVSQYCFAQMKIPKIEDEGISTGDVESVTVSFHTQM